MTPGPSHQASPPLAYLLSEYPHIRHAYLLREIRGLRKLGLTVHTIAVRPDDRTPGQCTQAEMEERASTFYIVNAGIGVILSAHLKTFFSTPMAWCAGLARALSYGDFHPRRTLYALYYFIEAVVAGRWITERGISHVHAHYASTVAWIMARVFPLEISMSIHGSGEFDDSREFRLGEKIGASKFVRAISYFGQSQIMRAVPYEQWSKIEICRLGIDPALFPPRPFRAAPFGDAPGPFEFLCVGGMANPRAFQILLQALAMAGPLDVILRFVGDGPDRPMLERLARELGIENRVIFEGWKHQELLRDIYARTDAFVFSSFAEGIPVVLMEAMAMSIPCVAPRITGIPELIRDGVDGLLFAASDAGELSLSMTRLIQDPALCRSLGESAHARILELYDLNQNIPALAGIFERWLKTD